MKKIIYGFFALLLSALLTVSCNDFLDTNYYEGVDTEDAPKSISDLETLLTGSYYLIIHPNFGGRNVLAVSDMASDLSDHYVYTTHFYGFFLYSIDDTDPYVSDIWSNGCRAVSQLTKIIIAAEKMLIDADARDAFSLNNILAQAYGLRALANTYLVNIFSLPYKVDTGVDNSDALGVVASETLILPGDQVERATVAKTYDFIGNDIQSSIDYYDANGYETEGTAYMNAAAVYALKARVALYSQEYDDAVEAAEDALYLADVLFQKGNIAYNVPEYRKMYNTIVDNNENIFYMQSSEAESHTALSIGTLYGYYGASFNDFLLSKFSDNDIRTSIMIGYDPDEDEFYPLEDGYKYSGLNGDYQIANVPFFRIPELHLILAEAHLKKPASDLGAAAASLLPVAKRNLDITSTADLPNDFNGLNQFIKDERARELCFEGHRFQDLRRWGDKVSVVAGDYINFDIAKFCYPIPSAEINSGFGVVQNPDWYNYLPNEVAP